MAADVGLSVGIDDIDGIVSGRGGNNGSVGGRSNLSQVFRSSCSLADCKRVWYCKDGGCLMQTYCWNFCSSSSILARLAMFFGFGLRTSGWEGGSSCSCSQQSI